MEILDQVAGVLEQDGYLVYRPGGLRDGLEFEDVTLFGIVQVFDSVENLLEGWTDTQSAFLDRHQARFQTVKEKAWNAYVVLLTADHSPSDSERITEIEENFYAARKIVGSSLEGRSSIRDTLSPLLKLRSTTVIGSAAPDQRLKQLDSFPEGVRELLAQGAAPEKLASHFLETS